MKRVFFQEYSDPVSGLKKILIAFSLILLFCVAGYLRYYGDPNKFHIFLVTYLKIVIPPFIIIIIINIKFLSESILYKVIYFLLLPLGLLLSKIFFSPAHNEKDNSLALEILSWCILIISPIPLMFLL